MDVARVCCTLLLMPTVTIVLIMHVCMCMLCTAVDAPHMFGVYFGGAEYVFGSRLHQSPNPLLPLVCHL